MNYRNPQQFIDTQTGQHYRNLIKNVTQTGDDIAKRIIARNAEVAERNNKIISDADKKEQAILQQFGNVTAGNPTFNYGEGFARYIDEYSDLNIAVNTGTSQNPQAARQRMAEIENLPTTARQGLEGLIEMTDNFIEKANNRGQMGGLDLAGIETEDLKSFLILADQLKGNRSFEVVEENGKLVPAYSLGDRMWTYTQIENYLNNDIAGGAFNVIPDETESFTKAAELAMIPDPQNPENKILDPKYYENEDEVEGKPDSKGNRVFYRPLNIDTLKKAPIGQMLKADGSSMTNADKISFWNNILSTEDNWAYGEPLSGDQLQNFEDAYIEYGLRNYLRQENDVRIVEPPEVKEQTATEKKETARKVRKQERFNEIKNLPLDQKTIRDYFVGKDFDNKRILDIEDVTQKIEGGSPRKIVTLVVASGGNEITEVIDITDDSQINNLLDQLSDLGPIPNDLPIFN